MKSPEQWNHNNHYHDWLLKNLSARFERALDIGSGQGLLAARLAARADRVDAIDVDAAVLAEAAKLHPSPRIAFREGDFLAMQLPPNAYDVVTSIAALHHMDFERALGEMKRVLRPGGRLAVLGLHRETSLLDYATVSLAVAPNFLRTHLIARRSTGLPMTAPTRRATLSLDEIRERASRIVPGARIKRHLYWRYSMLWQKPT